METKSSHSSSKRLRWKYIPKTELVLENDAWKTTSLSLPGNFSQAIVLCIYSYIYIYVYSCIQSVNTVNTIHAYYIHINIQVYQLRGLYEKKHGETPIRSTRRQRSLRSLRRASHHLPGTIFTSCCSHLPLGCRTPSKWRRFMAYKWRVILDRRKVGTGSLWNRFSCRGRVKSWSFLVNIQVNEVHCSAQKPLRKPSFGGTNPGIVVKSCIFNGKNHAKCRIFRGMFASSLVKPKGGPSPPISRLTSSQHSSHHRYRCQICGRRRVISNNIISSWHSISSH